MRIRTDATPGKPQPADRLQLLARYVGLGWPLVPLHHVLDGRCSCGNPDCGRSSGKHPRLRDWQEEASAEEATVRRWEADWPGCNWGVLTGERAGIFMVGPDGEQGLADMYVLCEELGGLPDGPLQWSGTAPGYHLVFAWPADGLPLTNRKNHREKAIDVRGHNGQFLVQPSVNLNGPYRWEFPPWECPPPPCPPAWLEWIRTDGKTETQASPAPRMCQERTGSPSAVERAIRYLDGVPGAVSGQGGHNQTLWAARVVVKGFGLDIGEAHRVLMDHYNPRCQPEWTEREIQHKILQAETVPFGKPFGWLRDAPLPNGRPHDPPPFNASPAAADPTPPPQGAAAEPEPRQLRNYYVADVDGKPVKVGLAAARIACDLSDLTGGWPRRVGDRLFARGDDDAPLWLDAQEGLMAFAGRHLSGGLANGLHWVKGEDKLSQAHFFAHLRQTTERFDAVEALPHFPPMPAVYYMHRTPEGGDGQALARFVARFRPAEPVDAQLIRALLLTLFWGGSPGQRPAFLIEGEADDPQGGRGLGKSTLAQMAAALAGGHIDARPGEDIDKLMTRVLSKDALHLRAALLDNVKTLRFSWADLEALITTDVISGRKLYVGEGRRPNTLTWLITLNGASLSRDMAQRVVPIAVRWPPFDATWEDDTKALLARERWAIVGDLLALLQREVPKLERYSRWSAWEQGVLSRVEDPAACQEAIARRQQARDDDTAEADIIREGFAEELRRRRHDPDREAVWIPARVAAAVVNEATGEKYPTNRATSYLGTLTIAELRKSNRQGVRGWAWRGVQSDPQAAAGPLGERPASVF
jgi:hypothetical protein